MPRGIYKRKTQLTLVQPVIPQTTFTEWAGWKKLDENEQKVIMSEGQLLADSLLSYGKSKMAIGEHLSKIKIILEPHNLFRKFLRNFHFTERTAYRYIKRYENALVLPESVVKAALTRGVDITGDTDKRPFGVYTEAAAKLPPPKEPTSEQAETWLSQLEKVRKEGRTSPPFVVEMPVTPQDPQTLLKECYRFVSLRYKRLPTNHKTRAAWVRSLTGMLLADLGVSGAQSIQPTAIPEEFRAQRGRPVMPVAASA